VKRIANKINARAGNNLTGGLSMDAIKNFWLNVEAAAAQRGIDVNDLALSVGARPGDRVVLEQATDIQKRLNSQGPILSLDALLKK
jgi:hypothetical protein